MLFKTNNYEIELSPKGEIKSLIFGGKQFIKTVLPLLKFRLRNGSDTKILDSNKADGIKFSKVSNQVQFSYVFNSPKITFTAKLTFNDRIEATFSYENNSDMCTEWVDFPQIAVPNDLVRNGGSGRLVIDTNEGLLIEDLSAKEDFYPYKYKEMEYPSLGLYSMFPAVVQSQFLAYYDDNAGIYMAAEDTDRGIKGIDFAPLENAVKLQFRLYPALCQNECAVEIPYNIVIDFFKGDWHNAATLYRNWFENNLPKNLCPISQNSALPEWYSDSPLIVTYPVQGIHDMDEAKPNKLFPYNNALPIIEEISAETESRVMALLMHWEGTAPWAPPYVWPPLGGEEVLKDFGEKLHQKNNLLGVYCSGIGYTIKSNINDYNMEAEYERQGIAKYMCQGPDGDIESYICQAQRKSYDMCISQDFTKELLIKEAEKIASSGLDYVQLLDQNHGGTPYFCYSNNHGHPAVPGKWMVEHMTDFLQKLKAVVGNNVLLGCESAAAEAYVPYLNLSDNRFNLNYRSGKPIPLYAFVYHKYLHNFSGNSVSSMEFVDIHRSPDCHMLRMAHSFLAGDLMTLVINQEGEIVWSWGERDFTYLPERQPILDFVKTATAIRRGVGKKYLVSGEMVKPKPVECERVAMYRPDSDYATYYPAVLTTAFKSCEGETAQFLASYRKQAEKCAVDLTETKGAKMVDEHGMLIKELKPEICEITVPANSVVTILFN